MMKYTITVSRTVRPADYERFHVGVSRDFDDASTPMDKGYDDVKAFVGRKVAEGLAELAERGKTLPRGAAPPEPTPKAPAAPKPGFRNIPELERLPWTSYRTREDCEKGEAGWIMATTPGAERLVSLIQRENGRAHVVLDGVKMVCSFSGDPDPETKLPAFISRKRY